MWNACSSHCFGGGSNARMSTRTGLWSWLQDSKSDRYSSAHEERDWLNGWLKQNEGVRRQLQRKVLDACLAKPRSLWWRLQEVAPGLKPTDDDVIDLLGYLPEGDARWAEAIWLAPPREQGERVRVAALRHVLTESDQLRLKEHADPSPLPVDPEHRDWQERQDREQRKRKESARSVYLGERERMRRGDWGVLAGPAQVYMGCSHEGEKGLPPQDRIGRWIGEDLQADAFAGFEAFLTASPPKNAHCYSDCRELCGWSPLASCPDLVGSACGTATHRARIWRSRDRKIAGGIVLGAGRLS